MSKSLLTSVLSLTLTLLMGIVVTVPIAVAQASCPFVMDEISDGDTLSGRISESSPVHQFCFEGVAGDEITIDLSRVSGSLDAFLELTDVDGNEVFATNDDRSLSTTDSQIVFKLPETMAYVINATRFDREDGSTQGTFELTLKSGNLSQTNASEDTRPDGCPVLYDSIRYGEIVEGTLDNETSLFAFCFVGDGGDEVVIDAEASSGDLDTLLLLTDLQLDEVFAENDDVRLGDRNSRIVYTLPESGSYLITITRYNLDEGDTEGDFTLSLKLNDGTLSDDELFIGVNAPNRYECNRPLMKQLNKTQWQEDNTDYDFRLNFGCEGLVAVSILGEQFVVPYAFVNNELEITLNNEDYTVNLATSGQLHLNNSKGQTFTFNDVGECSTSAERDLLDGVWFLDENTTLFRLDFMCNGVAILTLEDVPLAYDYDFNTSTDQLTIQSEDQIVWTDVFILPGSFMSVETEEEPFIFTNILVEIEGTDEADI